MPPIKWVLSCKYHKEGITKINNSMGKVTQRSKGAEIATLNKKQNNDDASVIQRINGRIILSSGKGFRKIKNFTSHNEFGIWFILLSQRSQQFWIWTAEDNVVLQNSESSTCRVMKFVYWCDSMKKEQVGEGYETKNCKIHRNLQSENDHPIAAEKKQRWEPGENGS